VLLLGSGRPLWPNAWVYLGSYVGLIALTAFVVRDPELFAERAQVKKNAKAWDTVVRIQADRGHTVATGGPYRFVRHPGYIGFIVGAFGTALLLGSRWALVPAALAGALVVVRTVLEDRTLRAELPGYADYAARVRYRLLPRVW